MAYTDAFLNGANFIEVTLQVTADKVLIVNSEICLSNSTTAPLVWKNNSAYLKNVYL